MPRAHVMAGDSSRGKAFVEVLSGELSRVIRARGANEETEKEHGRQLETSWKGSRAT